MSSAEWHHETCLSQIHLGTFVSGKLNATQASYSGDDDKMMDRSFWRGSLGSLQPLSISRTPAVPLGLCRVRLLTFSNYSSKMTGESKHLLGIHFKHSSNFGGSSEASEKC